MNHNNNSEGLSYFIRQKPGWTFFSFYFLWRIVVNSDFNILWPKHFKESIISKIEMIFNTYHDIFN